MQRKPVHDRRSFLKIAGSAGAAGMAGFAGCTGGGDGGTPAPDETPGDGGQPSPTPTATKAGEKEAFKVGLVTPLSGPLGASGKEHLRGATMSVEEINANGGIMGHPVELLERDTEASPDTAVKRSRQLVEQENVDILAGLISSAVAKTVNQFAASQNVPLVTFAAQTPDITKTECRRTTFRITTNIIHQQKASAYAFAQHTPDDATRVAGINPDYVFGHQSWEIFQREFKNYRPDVEYVETQFPAFLKGDYKKEIQATLNADPDIVHSVLYSGDMIAFIKQAHQFNFFDQIDHFLVGAPIAVMLALENQMPEAVSYAPAYAKWPETERTRTFTQEYVDRHRIIPDFFSYYAHGGMTAIKLAAERGGGISVDDFVAGFEGLTFQSVLPDTTIRAADHQGIPEGVLTGRLGPLDESLVPDKNVYGFVEMDPAPADTIKDQPECTNF